MGEKGNSSIVLLPNMPQAGSEMLNSLGYIYYKKLNFNFFC